MSSDNLYSPRKPRYAVVLFGPEGQGSFNESGLRGAHKARDAGHEVDVLWVAGQSAQQRAAEMSALCGGRYALILAHGGQGDGPVQILAERWPEQAFAVTQSSWAAPNVARYEVLQEQSAFLAGVLAGQWSKTGKVRHFSGEKVPPGLRGRAAYADGLRRAGFEGQLVTQFCGHQHRPGWARTCVSAMVEQTDLDIVFAMLDGGKHQLFGNIGAAEKLHHNIHFGVLHHFERVFRDQGLRRADAAAFLGISGRHHKYVYIAPQAAADFGSVILQNIHRALADCSQP